MCEIIRGEMCEGAKCATRFKRGETWGIRIVFTFERQKICRFKLKFICILEWKSSLCLYL